MKKLLLGIMLLISIPSIASLTIENENVVFRLNKALTVTNSATVYIEINGFEYDGYLACTENEGRAIRQSLFTDSSSNKSFSVEFKTMDDCNRVLKVLKNTNGTEKKLKLFYETNVGAFSENEARRLTLEK